MDDQPPLGPTATRLRRLTVGALFLISCAVRATNCVAQQLPPPPPLEKNPSTGGNVQAGELFNFFSSRTPYEFWLSVLVVGFGLVVIIGLLFWHSRGRSYRSADVPRLVVVVMVITAALVLVTASYSNEQIAPAFGLFGTIVGYLLGKLDRPPQSADETSHPTTRMETRQ